MKKTQNECTYHVSLYVYLYVCMREENTQKNADMGDNEAYASPWSLKMDLIYLLLLT